jgi:cation:H+ antiporter
MDTTLLLVGGLVALLGGAELLVRGASRLATVAGISPLVIGLTVVAWGTSTPELVVSSVAALEGRDDIAVANVVGSNVFNVLFILGACALVLPLRVAQQLVRLDVPIMIGCALLLWLLGADGRISRPECALLLALLLAYTVFVLRLARRESPGVAAEYQEALARATPRRRWPLDVALVLAGLGLLVLGGQWLVDGAVRIAQAAGLSETVIGLTIVAAGTSLPEVATSLLAALRGERDIAVGNVVGSNIYNVLAILGLPGLLAPEGLSVAPALLHVDIPVMLAVSFACLPIFVTGHRVDRWEGGLFLAYYAGYTTWLVLATGQHDAAPAFGSAMLEWVLPLTLVTIMVSIAHAAAERRDAGAGPN